MILLARVGKKFAGQTTIGTEFRGKSGWNAFSVTKLRKQDAVFR